MADDINMHVFGEGGTELQVRADLRWGHCPESEACLWSWKTAL